MNSRLNIYTLTKYVAGTSFDFKSTFDDLESTGSRQSVFIFGNINGPAMYGVLMIRGVGECIWSGSPSSVTANMDSSGRITINLPNAAYDSLTMISPYKLGN